MYNYYEVVQQLQYIYQFLNDYVKPLLVLILFALLFLTTINVLRWYRSK